jgi:predicted phage gp36 major capsid-like protein
MVYSSLVQLVTIEDEDTAAIAAVVDAKPRAIVASANKENDGYASDSVQKLKTKEVAGLGEVKNIEVDDGVSRAISV